MKTSTINNTKLGLFVITGVTFLIFSLYMIGRNRNMFGASFRISANFRNINGLAVGNNVRFSGIDVGTVDKIEIASDTVIQVTMVLEKGIRKFIRKNALASVGTDGLMGNKLINISAAKLPAESVRDGDTLHSLRPIEGDEMLRTLNTTNENMEAITNDLKNVTRRINTSEGLWSILSDTTILEDLKGTGKHLKQASSKIAETADMASALVKNAQRGKGLAGTILSDSIMAAKLKASISNIEEASRRSATATAALNDILQHTKQGVGPVGTLLADSTMERKVKSSLTNIDQGTQKFNENMEALKHNFLFRGYFKKQEKAAKSKK